MPFQSAPDRGLHELPHRSSGLAPTRFGFSVEVVDDALREELIGVGTRSGWCHRGSGEPGDCCVTDRPATECGRSDGAEVLVVEPSPYAAQLALEALGSGCVAALVSRVRPQGLATALEAVAKGWVVAPCDVVERASEMPELTERQLEVIQAVVSGLSTSEMAHALHLSLASVKRELSTLYRGLGAGNRVSLVVLGRSLGFQPHPGCASPGARFRQRTGRLTI